MADCLRVRNMVFHGYHGLLPEEARLGQRFEVDVELRLDLAPAGGSDDPERTVDYASVYRVVEGIVAGPRRYQLVEAVAEAVASAVANRFALVESIRVRVRKPHPPVPGHFDGLEVEIERPGVR